MIDKRIRQIKGVPTPIQLPCIDISY
jgi:hypothetical protein